MWANPFSLSVSFILGNIDWGGLLCAAAEQAKNKNKKC